MRAPGKSISGHLGIKGLLEKWYLFGKQTYLPGKLASVRWTHKVSWKNSEIGAPGQLGMNFSNKSVKYWKSYGGSRLPVRNRIESRPELFKISTLLPSLGHFKIRVGILKDPNLGIFNFGSEYDRFRIGISKNRTVFGPELLNDVNYNLGIPSFYRKWKQFYSNLD